MEKYNNELMKMFKKAEKYDELSFLSEEKVLHCSFCGKRQEDVRKLIASPLAIICDECVAECNKILKDEFEDKEEDTEEKVTK
ncbi:ClpX C4-type zinc finger protein [Lysinibacillus sp. NPDC086135]|uniref:ClpX C4-type zinc finger protein n=1 Tax=Lysinibacillus sp. NPDC086135 TaxID=3364130 RepID=UPI003805BF5D